MSLTPPPLRSGSVPAIASPTAGMGGARPLPPHPPAGLSDPFGAGAPNDKPGAAPNDKPEAAVPPNPPSRNHVSSRWTMCVAILVAAFLPALARADIYAYTGADRTGHFSNSPSADARYRLCI